MFSESWGEYIFSLVCLFGATPFFFWGSSGIIKQELHWRDNSEYSSGAQGTVRGGSAVGLGFLIILFGVFWLGGAIYLLSGLEWYPLSFVVYLRLFVLVLLIIGAVALGILIYLRGNRVWVQKTKYHEIPRLKMRKRYKGKVAPLPYDPTWLIELAKEQIPEETDFINSLKSCTTIVGFCPCGCGAPFFIDPESIDWDPIPREAITLYKKDRWDTHIILTPMTDGRIGSLHEF